MAEAPAQGPDGRIFLPQAAAGLSGPWQPLDLVTVNDAVVRIAQAEGEFPWHAHQDDELFLCWEGALRIELEGRDPVPLEPGVLFVVPKGVRHRPVADRHAVVLLLERPETTQYGDAQSRP